MCNNKIKIYIIILSLFLLLPNCGGKLISSKKGETSNYHNLYSQIPDSQQRIENNLTKFVYFKLSREIDDFSVTVNLIDIKNDKNQITPYFIIEKEINVEKYNPAEKNVYTEIGRNFDIYWNKQPKEKISSIKNDPLLGLTPGNYRIRFTKFEDTEYYIDINISADVPVEFYIPEIIMEIAPIKTKKKGKQP